ncbi:MAG TPA: hybrid sensor histidine kinase/response regulator [Solibacterales bacterium]|nr:hybrid sensor histidine kinase/response regulator [Bryobacterales bacterium]
MRLPEPISLDALPEPVWVIALDDLRFVAVNAAARSKFAYSQQEFEALALPDVLQERDVNRFRTAVAAEHPNEYDLLGWRVKCKNGEIAACDISLCVAHFGNVRAAVLMPLDAAPRQNLEEQLRQSKKMEAVGMLAGGIAHDFNNLLTIISGYGQLLVGSLSEHDRTAMDQILRASDRAAGLTRQLLAYSRREELQPRALNLNDVLAEMGPMLHRLIGEHIDVRIEPSADIGMVHADPGQIEQVIMNLAVNARDAMTNGGTLVIETANVELGEPYTSKHMTVKSGRYISLSVTDTGIGMDEKTASQVFDPFFTTKGKHQGTGLGLSTVYGILKQSGGAVDVYSEPGRGTSVKVYLPRVDEAAPAPQPAAAPVLPEAEGRETVLVVEDEEAVRRLVLTTLERHGYKVVMASSGVEALHFVRDHTAPIQLLITDLVMPQMGGAEVVKRMRRKRPNIAVLCMSGYTDRSIQRTRSIAGLDFLQKPFTPTQLLQKVRQILDRGKEHSENAAN